MTTRELAKEMRVKFEEMLSSEEFEAYNNAEDLKGQSDLTEAISLMKRNSYAGSRDGDYIVATYNKPYEREIVIDDDTQKKFYGTDVYDFWEINDVPGKTFYLTLVSDADLTEEVE